VRAMLDEQFPTRWIGRGGPIPWPPRSCDYTPLDFYLWSDVKQKVYAQRSQNVNELTQRIFAAFKEIDNDKDKLERVMHNVTSRMLKSVNVGGGQLNAYGF
jgi:hypothetical protein